jgi:1,4-alpha-glucan branching enzyme
VRNVDGGNGDYGAIPEGYTLMKWVNEDINQRYPWKISIAEDLRGNHAITGDCGFDSQWDGDFVHPIRHQIIEGNDDSRSLAAVRSAIYHNFNGDPMQRVIYTESHDEVANGKSRVPEEAWPGNSGSWSARKRAAMGIFLSMTSPGIPMLFQGQEFAEDGFFDDSKGMDWGKLKGFGGKFYDMTRDLIRR